MTFKIIVHVTEDVLASNGAKPLTYRATTLHTKLLTKWSQFLRFLV